MNWNQHVEKWRNCQRCELHKGRHRVVLARGKIPADVVFVGEAPGECITGDTLIETAFRDKRKWPNGIPVKELVNRAGFFVYSFDHTTGGLALGKVLNVWKTGIKKVYRVTFSWWGAPPNGKGGRHKYFGSICVTDNHPFLLKTGEYRSIKQGLDVGNRLQPFYRFVSKRRHRVGVHSGSMLKEAPYLLGFKIGRTLQTGEQAHHDDRNPENDTWNNLMLLEIDEHARLHGLEDNAMFNPIHRATHKRVMESEEYRSKMSKKLKDHLSDPEAYKKRCEQIRSQRQQTSSTIKEKFRTDPVYYYRYLRGMKMRNGRTYTDDEIREKMFAKFPNESYPPRTDNHTVESVKYIGVQEVYDMEVEKYNNFAANGIFVHNSENITGLPFDGPAGAKLDSIVKASGIDAFRLLFANLVGCFPSEAKASGDHRPPPEAIKACALRVVELIAMAKPQLIVLVGSTAQDWYTDASIARVEIVHPSAILQAPVAQQSLMTRRCIVQLSKAMETLIPF